MSEEKTKYLENKSVFVVATGEPLTVEDYIDVNIAAGVRVRICLCKDEKTLRRKILLDNQLVMALDKHDDIVVRRFAIAWKKSNKYLAEEETIIGQGNLIKRVIEITNKCFEEDGGEGQVYMTIGIDTEIII